jgi:hypothetical protein
MVENERASFYMLLAAIHADVPMEETRYNIPGLCEIAKKDFSWRLNVILFR